MAQELYRRANLLVDSKLVCQLLADLTPIAGS